MDKPVLKPVILPQQPKLDPCKFCGCTTPVLARRTVNDYNYWYVRCPNCGIHTADFDETVSNKQIVAYEDAYKGICEAVDCAVSVWNMKPNVCATDAPKDDEQPRDESPWVAETMKLLEDVAKKVDRMCKRASK